jgi:two-component system sensor histidine kinase CreC
MRAQLEGKQYVERYVHALTHEMKSPLAAIRASAELLERPLPAGDQAHFAATIRAQSERLALMIDRMLALAAVEHRQRLEAPAPVAIAELLAAVAEDSRPRLAAKAQTLDVNANDAAHASGDAFLLRQALDNLVENASDFAPVGSTIAVDARVDGGFVLIHVDDQGPGVPDYARDRVFERFYSLPRPDGGHRSSGLGLNFVAQVADLHGGSATLENRQGGGARATLRLPAGN